MFGPSTPGLEPPQAAVPVGGVPGAPNFSEPEVHLLDRLSVLYKYRRVIISVTLLVLVAGVAQTLTTTPEYQATALIRAEPDTSTTAALQSAQQALYPDTDYFMQTELQVLRSRDLARSVVRGLHLVDDPEFTGTAPSTGLLDMVLTLATDAAHQARSWINSPKPSGATQAPPGVINPPVPVVPDPEEVETPAERRAIDTLVSHVDIQAQQTSNLFTVTVTSAFPRLAAAAANSLAQNYVSQNLEEKKTKVTEQLKQLDQTLKDLDEQIKADRQNQLQVQDQAQLLDADQLNANVNRAYSDWQAKNMSAQQAEAKWKEISGLDVNNLTAALAYPDVRNNQTITGYKQSLAALESQRQQNIVAGIGSQSPLMKQLDAQEATITKNIKDEISAMKQAAKSTYDQAVAESHLDQTMYQAQKDLQFRNSKNGISYGSLKSEIASKQDLYNQLRTQQEQTQIIAKGITNNVSVVDYAQPPEAPFKPDKARNMVISLAVGLALALMLAFSLDYLDDTIKTPEDITRKLHVPFLGLVPAINTDRQPVLSGPVPHEFGEAYRALRTSLVFTSGGELTRIITVTSAQPLEGKTTTACNLAMVLAFGGSRVLLIDADMRRPGVHKALKINNTIGLSHLLVGQARVREAVQRTSDPNFCVMTAGRTPPNPSELLSSERMKQLIANLKQGPFDWVVIDTPPVLAVTDAVILTPLIDGVVFVLGAEMTRRRLAERAVQTIMASRPKVVGAVLNRVNFDRNKYYYSRYYGYQYKSYYGTGHGSSSDSTSATAKA